MADLIRKQKKQIEKLMAERKGHVEYMKENIALKHKLDEREKELKAALAKWLEQTDRLGKAKELYDTVTAAFDKLKDERDTLQKEVNDRAELMRQYRASLKTERTATEALDKEVARLKQEAAKADEGGLAKTRRRLAERSTELDEVRRELSRMQTNVAELKRLMEYQERNARLHTRAGAEKLVEAVRALYLAARWTADRPVDEAALWEAVRDAAGIPEGSATAAGIGAET